MEHNIIQTWCTERGVILSKEQEEMLIQYAHLILKKNKLFNLTGFSTIDDILSNLVTGSLDPICNLNVPRGTSFADLGTGAGIPGVPIGILFNNLNGTLIDSNSKKTGFIESAIKSFGLSNLSIACSRLEDFAKDTTNRESFDIVFSRAMGSPYLALELGVPLLKQDGTLYIYSNLSIKELHPDILSHAEKLGARPIAKENHREFNIGNTGLLFRKINSTDPAFPRRFPVIKRESRQYE
ncbi:MAG: 16S rRNA (guanine(527)-N(7))-methyltransferase RsmG [bacterium]|nr:16S rRNA (guanine(527)-N(7))-methyltransferase RsmG [bacterium]